MDVILNFSCKSYLLTCMPISLSIRLTFMYHKTLKSLVLNCGFSFPITHHIIEKKGTEMVSDILDCPVCLHTY